jgi:hypothetical protein
VSHRHKKGPVKDGPKINQEHPISFRNQGSENSFHSPHQKFQLHCIVVIRYRILRHPRLTAARQEGLQFGDQSFTFRIKFRIIFQFSFQGLERVGAELLTGHVPQFFQTDTSGQALTR